MSSSDKHCPLINAASLETVFVNKKTDQTRNNKEFTQVLLVSYQQILPQLKIKTNNAFCASTVHHLHTIFCYVF